MAKLNESLRSLYRRSAFCTIFMALLLASNASSQNVEPVESARHVVVILSDTHRFDYVGAYAGSKVETPNIDSLLDRRSIRYTRAYAPTSMSAPSYASIYTGLYPYQHGVLTNTDKLPESVETMAEVLQREGFLTAGFVGNGFCDSRYGFSRGFKIFEGREVVGHEAAKLCDQVISDLEHWDPDTERLFLWTAFMDAHEPYHMPHDPPWLAVDFDGDRLLERERADNRFFTFSLDVAPGRRPLSFQRVAPPLKPGFTPEYYLELHRKSVKVLDDVQFGFGEGIDTSTISDQSYGLRMKVSSFPMRVYLENSSSSSVNVEVGFRLVRQAGSLAERLALYPEAIRHLDKNLGRLFQFLKDKGAFDETLVVFLSDHGEGLGDHGIIGHGTHLWEEQVKIPLIVSFPEPGASREVSELASLLDVPNTVLRLLGIRNQLGERRTLPGAVRGESNADEYLILQSNHLRSDPLVGVHDGRRKFVSNLNRNEVLLLDLATDPLEQHGVVGGIEIIDGDDELMSWYLKKVGVPTIFTPPNSTFSSDRQISPEEQETLRSMGYLD